MPRSYKIGKKRIAKVLNAILCKQGASLLDLGCGEGTYGRLVQTQCHKVGVDAVDYRGEYGLLQVYDAFYQMDIRDTDALKRLGHFTCCVAGDVLEHLTVADAQRVLRTMREISDYVIVAVPYMNAQHVKGNSWEEHRQPDLTPDIVTERYPELEPLAIYHFNSKQSRNGYGYYWCKGVSYGQTTN